LIAVGRLEIHWKIKLAKFARSERNPINQVLKLSDKMNDIPSLNFSRIMENAAPSDGGCR
jgi:hypothetical protein